MTCERLQRLREIATLFLKLGSIGFGGPAAHIAMMEREVVQKRRWLSDGEFLDLVSATNLIPGPNSTEMAMHIGYKRAGGIGLLVGGVSFIVPAMLIVTAIAWGYVRFGQLPQTAALLEGVKPVIIAIIIQAVWMLGKTAVKTRMLMAIGITAVVLAFLGLGEILILMLCALAMFCVQASKLNRTDRSTCFPMIGDIFTAQPSVLAGVGGAVAAVPFTQSAMFWFFLKVGATLFGSGYVLIAFLRTELVERCGWLTADQLVDAVSVGQFTPGPVLTTATFIGYLLSGPAGALVATIGIFLPAFVFVALSGPIIPRIRASPFAGAMLDGVNVGSLSLLAVVAIRLGQIALADWTSILVMLAAWLILFTSKLNSAWLILAGAVIGWVKTMF